MKNAGDGRGTHSQLKEHYGQRNRGGEMISVMNATASGEMQWRLRRWRGFTSKSHKALETRERKWGPVLYSVASQWGFWKREAPPDWCFKMVLAIVCSRVWKGKGWENELEGYCSCLENNVSQKHKGPCLAWQCYVAGTNPSGPQTNLISSNPVVLAVLAEQVLIRSFFNIFVEDKSGPSSRLPLQTESCKCRWR